MAPELIYYMKVNVALILFYAFYRLFFYKDTFFHLRRTTLLTFFLLAVLYPLFNIQDWVKEQMPMSEVITIYSGILPEISVTAESVVQTTDWKQIFKLGFITLYGLGVLFFVIRFFVQLGSILRIASKSQRTTLFGKKVYVLPEPAGPFSFFRMIFIHPFSHTEEEVKEIITHECTHVAQYHSVDVMVAEIVNIFCWINPFMWLLKREVRYNLEYLADNKVISLGYDTKSYQYHLLGLAHQQAGATIYNGFNVLDLKNRISMMNIRRTHGLLRAKYLLFLPLVLVLMLGSNVEVVARLTNQLGMSYLISPERIVEVSGTVTTSAGAPVSTVAIVQKGETLGTISDTEGNFSLNVPASSTLVFHSSGMQSQEVTISPLLGVKPSLAVEMDYIRLDETVFTVVEEMPEFPGGEGELMKFIHTNVKYPVEAQEKGYQGRVICAFVIDRAGSIRDIEVLRGVDPLLDREAVRVISLMPNWKPGRQRGENVSVKYTVPIAFRLQ